MGRRSKSLDDYRALARDNDLEFAGLDVPSRARQSTLWKCLRCGRTLRKSWNNLRYGKNACVCRTQKQLHASDYAALGRRLGLEWRGKTIPQNVHAPTAWFSPHQKTGFDATYHQLAYGKVPKILKRYIHDGEGGG